MGEPQAHEDEGAWNPAKPLIPGLSPADGLERKLAQVRDVELGLQEFPVGFYRPDADVEAGRDVFLAPAIAGQLEHLQFPIRKIV